MRIPPGELSRTWHFEDASNNRCVQVFQPLEIPTQEPPAAPRHQTRLHQRYISRTNTMYQSHTFGGFKCMTVVNTADFRLCNSFQVWLPWYLIQFPVELQHVTNKHKSTSQKLSNYI